MAKFNATSLIITLDGNVVARATSGEFTMTNNLIETTDKDSSGKAEFIYGKQEWDISVEALIDFGATFGVEGFFDALDGKTTLAFIWTNKVSGDLQWSGTVLVSDVGQSAPLEDVGSWSGTLKGTGTVTKATIA